MIKYGLILLLICFCASLVLSVTYQFTHSRIEAQAVSEENEALDDVFPSANKFEQKTLEETNYYLTKKANKVLGYILKVETKGYSGPINMLVGFDLEEKIQGIKILSHIETPGLGAKITEIRQGEDSPWFLKQFAGKNAQSLELGKDVQAITAATISSKAVLEGVRKEIVEFLEKIK